MTPNISVTGEGRVDAVWWDFRHDPEQDIYVRAAQFAELGGSGSSGARHAIAAITGLAGAGLVLLLVGRAGRGRGPG